MYQPEVFTAYTKGGYGTFQLIIKGVPASFIILFPGSASITPQSSYTESFNKLVDILLRINNNKCPDGTPRDLARLKNSSEAKAEALSLPKGISRMLLLAHSGGAGHLRPASFRNRIIFNPETETPRAYGKS